MSTTEILFNSPALHSLKRNQLVQLCKRHNIKATGKNTDIIVRLRQHALSLPIDAPLNVAIRSEERHEMAGNMELDGAEDEAAETQYRAHRPSELWEVVMDDIPEESASQQGTLSSMKSLHSVRSNGNGEFGTTGSKSASMSSSIRALATSLGLKRSGTNSSFKDDAVYSKKSSNSISSRKALSNLASNIAPRDSLTANAIPYASLPPAPFASLPQTDPFTLEAPDISMSSIDRPIPGFSGREGTEAAGNGSSTIRLITTPFVSSVPSPPHLCPFEPAFELVPPTPGNVGGAMTMWPMSPLSAGNGHTMYPPLPLAKDDDDMDVEMPGGLAPARSTPEPLKFQKSVRSQDQPLRQSILSPPRSEPFIFGSPNPRYSISNTDFTSAAASVLAEMNARLGLNGEQAVGIDLIAGRALGQASKDREDLLNHQFGGSKLNGKDRNRDIGDRFEKVHEGEFERMESIQSHYAAKRGLAARGNATSLVQKKRKSSVLGSGHPQGLAKTRRSSTRVISAGSRRHMVPGGFQENDDDDGDEEDRRTSKRLRVSALPKDVGTAKLEGRRVAIAALPSKDADGDADSELDSEEERIKKERDAIRRKLEYNKAKRRSSMGRVSVGGGKAPLVPNQKPKGATSRFGFLSSAKSLVKSVWNRGAGGTTSSSTIPAVKPVPAQPATTKPALPEKKQKQVLTKPPPSSSSTNAKGKEGKKPTVQGIKPSTGGRISSRTVSADSNHLLKPNASATISSVSSNTRSRSLLPPSGAASGSIRSTNASTASKPSRPGSYIGAANGISTRAGSTISSMGTRKSMATSAGMSSVGTRSSLASTASSAGSRRGPGDASTRKRTSSTLLAPTASSLAKMQSSARPPTATMKVPVAPVSSAVNDRTGNHRQDPRDVAYGNRGQPSVSSGQAVTTASNIDMIVRLTATPSRIPISPMSPRSRPDKIFSQPITLPTSPDVFSVDKEDPGPVVNPITGMVSPRAPGARNVSGTSISSVALGDKSRLGSVQRKPRISRSRVIAKLGAKRAASGSASSKVDGANSGHRPTRSSVGAAVAGQQGRRSYGGVKASSGLGSGRGSGVGAAVLLSAKKRARQSEYMRRRSARGQSTAGGRNVDGET